jgi:hypothetical protein
MEERREMFEQFIEALRQLVMTDDIEHIKIIGLRAMITALDEKESPLLLSKGVGVIVLSPAEMQEMMEGQARDMVTGEPTGTGADMIEESPTIDGAIEGAKNLPLAGPRRTEAEIISDVDAQMAAIFNPKKDPA